MVRDIHYLWITMQTSLFSRANHLALALAGLLCCACETTSSTSGTEAADTLEVSDLFTESGSDYDYEDTRQHTGTYTGLLPCADCAGIKTEILVSDSTYIKRTIYLGEGRPDLYEARGGASWDNNSRILTLGGLAPPNRYLVGNNTLTQLDRKGRKITGRLANRYVLQKE
jgi:hypothetical protein